MKLKKALLTIAALSAAALTLAGCQGGSSKKEVDVAALADDLNSKTVTSDTLSETSSDMLPSIYFFEEGQVADSKVYMSSGATANEICVVECSDEDTAKIVTDLLKARVENQSKLYETYNADEVGKLGNAIVRSSGPYAILVVCDNYEDAETILKDAGL